MDIRAKKSGVFVKGLVESGAEISVGADLYTIDTSAKELPTSSEVAGDKIPPAAPPAPTVEKVIVPVPIMGESITTGVISKWNIKTGDYVEADHVVAIIETDKVSVDVRSPNAGTIIETFAQEGDEVSVGNNLFVLGTGGAPPAKAAIPATPKVTAAPAAPKTPAVQKTTTPATPPKAASTTTTTPAASPQIAGQVNRSETRVKMTRMRQRIAQRLKEAQNTAAMLTTFQEVDMSNLIAIRNKHKEAFEKVHGVKMGFMSAFVRAATISLQEIPAVNGVIDDSTNEIIYRNYVDISVAVSSPTGLVVPVLRNTENMNFADVEKSIAMYGKKAKEGSLALEDMTGGTFTISNGGVFGSLMGTPIINPPQSAILGMHATKMRPVVTSDNKIEARPMMYLALTYDHRLIDGREAVTFLVSIKNKIEDPSRLLLNL